MKQTIVFAATTILLFACGKKELPKKQSVNLDLSCEVQQVNTQTVIQDPGNQMNYISSVDSTVKYGFGYKLIIPDSLKGSNLKIVYSGSIKETESLTGEIVFSVHEQNMNTLFWGTQNSGKITNEIGKWVDFKDSLMIFSDKNPRNAAFLFVFNQKLSGKGSLCVDNLNVKIFKE